MFNGLGTEREREPPKKAGTVARVDETGSCYIVLVTVPLICQMASATPPGNLQLEKKNNKKKKTAPANIARHRSLKTNKAKYNERGACETKRASLHNYAENACAFIRYVLKKEKKVKTQFRVPRATFDPEWKRLIGP